MAVKDASVILCYHGMNDVTVQLFPTPAFVSVPKLSGDPSISLQLKIYLITFLIGATSTLFDLGVSALSHT